MHEESDNVLPDRRDLVIYFQKNMALFSFFLMFAAALGYKRQEPDSLIPPQAFGIAQNGLVNMDRTTRRSVNS